MTDTARHLPLRLATLTALAALALAGGGPSLAADDGAEQARHPVAPMPPLRPAEFDESLQIGGEEIDAPKLRSRMTVEVHVNEQGPWRFVVDSGADTSVVGEKLAALLGLPAGRPTMLNGMTETRQVDQVLVDELRLGPTTIGGLEVPVLKEHDIGGDGMIGLDALVEQRLMMDFDKRVITVDDGRTPMPAMDGLIVVRGKLRRGQLILTQVEAGRISLDAVVDTGSEITIGNSALRAKLTKGKGAKVTKVRVYGVTGVAADLDLITVPRLKLGPVVLENVPVAFADVPPFTLFELEKKPALLLGTDLMESFRRVSLDFHDRKVRFQLRKCMGTTVLRTSTQASRLSADQASACAR